MDANGEIVIEAPPERMFGLPTLTIENFAFRVHEVPDGRKLLEVDCWYPLTWPDGSQIRIYTQRVHIALSDESAHVLARQLEGRPTVDVHRGIIPRQ